MASTSPPPVARSPVPAPPPTALLGGWLVSSRRSSLPLTLADVTALAKVQLRADPGGAVATAVGVRHGRSARGRLRDALLIGAGPGEWLALGAPGSAAALATRLTRLAGEAHQAGGAEPAAELVSVCDLTHGLALFRLTGARSSDLLAKLCGVDLADDATPDGAAFRSSVARVVADVIRDDVPGQGPAGGDARVRSYLIGCETASGSYLHDALCAAGREYDLDLDGFRPLHPGA